MVSGNLVDIGSFVKHYKTVIYLVILDTESHIHLVLVDDVPIYVIVQGIETNGADLIDLCNEYNDLINEFNSAPGIITRIDYMEQEQAMGYQDEHKEILLKCTLKSGIYKSKKIYEFFESIGGLVVNKRISIESHFLLDNSISIQGGCNVDIPLSGYGPRARMITPRNVRPAPVQTIIQYNYCILRADANSVYLQIHDHFEIISRQEDVNKHIQNTLDSHHVLFICMSPDTEDDMWLLSMINISRVNGCTNDRFSVRCAGYIFVNLHDVFKKLMVSPPLVAYTLMDAMDHPGIYPPSMEKHPDVYRDVRGSMEVIDTIIRYNNILINYIEFSSASHTRVEHCISMGQQIRVWNKLCHTLHVNNLFIDTHRLLKTPAFIKRIPQSESSFPRNADSSAIVKEGATGGAVRDPVAGFHERITAILDFGSLYPSIIAGNEICFRRLCVSSDMDDNDIYTKMYIPINDFESVVFITGKRNVDTGDVIPTPTILPQMIKEVVQERTNVKNKLREEKNEFKRAILSAKQLSCKVFQNSVYGFLGVDEKYCYISCRVLMNVVCAIGRFMIQHVADVVEQKYNGVIVYGDTDSILVQFPHIEEEEPNPELCLKRFYMECRDICRHCNTLFPSPNELEFENAVIPLLLTEKKKMYAGLKFPPSDHGWTKEPEFFMKGFGATKRDRAPFVRRMGSYIMKAILHGKETCIDSYVRGELQDMLCGRMSIYDFVLSAMIKPIESYKNPKLPHVTAIKQIEHATGKQSTTGSRIRFIIKEGTGNIHEKGFPLSLITDERPDLQYYLQNQLMPAMKSMLIQHPPIMYIIQHHIEDALRVIYQSSIQTRSIDTFFTKQPPH
jgi:DNA polymerase elongation subunit (family B)